jgi:hypothetical protein
MSECHRELETKEYYLAPLAFHCISDVEVVPTHFVEVTFLFKIHCSDKIMKT